MRGPCRVRLRCDMCAKQRAPRIDASTLRTVPVKRRRHRSAEIRSLPLPKDALGRANEAPFRSTGNKAINNPIRAASDRQLAGNKESKGAHANDALVVPLTGERTMSKTSARAPGHTRPARLAATARNCLSCLPCLIGSPGPQREHVDGHSQALPANTESLPSRAAVAACRLLTQPIRVSRAREKRNASL
jgi:hypothetical protein